MKLRRVTVTGADDPVPHEALADLAREFPWLEIGVLYSLKRSGAPRYPSDGWRQELFRHVEARQISLHFCGDAARAAMAGIVDGLPYVPGGCRLQLNGFSQWKLPALLLAHARQDLEIILQCDHMVSTRGKALHLRSMHENVVALFDASGGKGLYQPEEWFMAPGDLRCGYAGGVNEFNVERAAALVAEFPGGDTWLDLETGARDHQDRFDLAKVRRVLELAKPFVEAS
jgi:phosphoribosylanthranilate isomerase